MARKVSSSRDLCVYMVEPDDNGVKQEIINLVVQCIQNKIFSGSDDTLCVSRDDEGGEFEFSTLTWELLRKVTNTFRNVRNSDSKPDPIATISTICESMEVQALEDAYEAMKILYFTDLILPLKAKQIRSLVTKIEGSQIFLTIVVPDKMHLTAAQEENVEIMKNSFEHLNTVYISSLTEISKLLANTVSKKPKRAMPWNVDLEVGPDLRFGVQAFIQTRKNTSSELKTALKKIVTDLPVPLAIEDDEPSTSNALAITNKKSSSLGETPSTDIVLASQAVQKEAIWTQEDGTVIDAEQVIPAYFYGDRVVPLDATEQEFQFKSGDKCLKVVLFCPRENIWPCFMLGDGNDIVVSNPKDAGSDLKLNALVKALHNTNRVAVVRKVRQNNAKLAIGVLAPDMAKKCLIYTKLCYADDISIPYFPPLIKEEESSSLHEGLNEKDNLIDELILSMSIDTYTLESGPVDPAVLSIRDSITRKIIGKQNPLSLAVAEIGKQEVKPKDNIDTFFESIVSKDNVIEKLQASFPLKMIPIKSMERPSGAQIFHKRGLDDPDIAETAEDKKIKLEGDVEIEEPEQRVLPIEYEADNLLDDL